MIAIITLAVAAASPCPIVTPSPTATLAKAAGTAKILTTVRRNPDSNEPVVRSIIDYASGTTIVIEQSNCRMENLRIAILSPDAAPSDTDLGRAGRILGAMPIWTRNYPRRAAGDVFRIEAKSSQFRAAKRDESFFYGVDQRLDAPAAAAEAIVAFSASDSPAAPYKSQMSLYLGIGGL